METLRLENLSKSFGGLHILKDISLSVNAGEYVAVIGPNGAGKTTLLKTITGEIPVNSGKVHLFEKDITNYPVHRRVQAGLGRSFQITRLFYQLSVLDNVTIALRATHSSRFQLYRHADSYGELRAEAEDLLKSIDLFDKKAELVSAISYGEQRRMEILLSLAAKPKVLLMDEPTVGLSTNEIQSFIETIKALSAGTTVVFSAHDMNVVFTLATRIVVLYFGKLIAEGTPEEIQLNPQVREIYLGKQEGAANVAVD